MTFTDRMPSPTAPEFPLSLAVGRPDDADSLRRWLAWLSLAVWPTAPDHPPFAVSAGRVAGWPLALNRTAWLQVQPGLGDMLQPPDFAPHQFAAEQAWDDYHRQSTAYLMTVGGSAHAASHVTVDDGYQVPDTGPMLLHSDRTPVVLESWQRFADGPDTPALWLWSLADRTPVDGRRTERIKARAEDQLQPALGTAGAIHDALELLLPQITEEPPTNTPRKASQWR